ncbi:MAG: alpha/beta fold hydrolase [Solirubrobacteraceae bacterium]|nr:alpha/beta fold hydrolase [Solirubrobacteraceae bacterium]
MRARRPRRDELPLQRAATSRARASSEGSLRRILRRVLILHGWYGSAGPHWQRWLAPELRAAGCDVRFPELPDATLPTLSAWRATLDAELEALAAGPGERIVVCHSLGCMLWLHHTASRSPGAPTVDRVVLNAPPGPLRELPTFFPVPLDPDAVAAAAGHTRMVGSDDDPYCPAGAGPSYAEPLGLPFDFLPGQGHINVDAGYGPWPAMRDWCLGRRDALAARDQSGAKNGVET